MPANESEILEQIEKTGRYEIKGKKYPMYLARSTTCGVGLFSDADIAKGEVISVLRGRVITFDPITQAADDHTSLMVSKTQILLADSPILRFCNHSCDPNMIITGTRTYTAYKDICRGDELTFDYAACENSNWQLETLCRCGHKNCRKTIVGIMLMDDETYEMIYETIPVKQRK